MPHLAQIDEVPENAWQPVQPGPLGRATSGVTGMKFRSDDELLAMLTPRQLDELAPVAIEVPSGSRIRLDYSETPPVLAVRLQELFGLADTPRIAAGRQVVKLHLLSPARRPVQVTQDLASFWANTYAEVKKDLKGRYPKHYWPDDPLIAEPTARAKPRGQ